MSGEPETTEDETEPTPGRTGTGPTMGISTSGMLRWIGYVAAIVFWGWMVLRWVTNWGWNPWMGADELFIPVGVIEGYSPAFAEAAGYLPDFATGAYFTVLLTVVSILIGLVIAIPLSVARIYGRYTSYLSLSFTELIRGTPLVAQLFVLYYGFNLSQYFRGILPGLVPNAAVWVALIGFTINSSAYQAEYIRTALQSVDRDQLVAARSIGLTQLAGIRRVVLPQGLRYAIPGWTNELVYLIKYSSLATFISVPELFNRAENIANTNYKYTLVFGLVALVYLAIVLTATQSMEAFEDYVRIPGVGTTDAER
ncbi:MAG: polar amino acid transport system permease protein [Natrialbaceae archaeon]|jgi:polar amino acid transport system permease protein